jgi:hypothetical protein
MALFRRKKNQEVMPDEVRDYYETEQRNRNGVTWLLAIGAFLLTAALVVGLFFAGRWVYQRFFDETVVDTTETTTVENGLTEEPEAGVVDRDQVPETDPSADVVEDEGADEVPSGAEAPSTNDTEAAERGQVGSGTTTAPPDDSDAEDPTREVAVADTQQTPAAGPSDDLPETGPAGVMGLFVATTLVGTIAHRVFAHRWIRR